MSKKLKIALTAVGAVSVIAAGVVVGLKAYKKINRIKKTCNNICDCLATSADEAETECACSCCDEEVNDDILA